MAARPGGTPSSSLQRAVKEPSHLSLRVLVSGSFSGPGTAGRPEQAVPELVSSCGQRQAHGVLSARQALPVSPRQGVWGASENPHIHPAGLSQGGLGWGFP